MIILDKMIFLHIYQRLRNLDFLPGYERNKVVRVLKTVCLFPISDTSKVIKIYLSKDFNEIKYILLSLRYNSIIHSSELRYSRPN